MESEILSVIPIPLTTKFRSRRCSDSLPLNRLDSSSDLELRETVLNQVAIISLD